jgi:alpha-tubulin suppressor-like RCC1 family protein
MRLLLFVALGGCYQAPASDPSCSILCEDRCPAGMTCHNGYCVGDGQTCEPELATVRAGNGFACALDTERRLWCWGANDHHQIDDTDRLQIAYASLVGNERWDTIATGGDHVCALREGELYCWGGNDRQQITGTVAGDVRHPLKITSPTGAPWRHVATGYNATCAVADRLYCWGAGDGGQLGNGATGDIGVPTPVTSTLADWTQVSLGRYHACAVSASAGLHCWGYNYYGQVGDGAALYTNDLVLAPVVIDLPGTSAVAVAASSTCAIADGTLHCWGYHDQTVLGDPALTDVCAGPRNVPQPASGLDGWSAIAAGQYMSCALRGSEVWCWGTAPGGGGLGTGVWNANGWGRIAQGASDVTVGWNANVDDGGDTQDLDLACILIDGEVQCWGDNRYGQLAQGSATMHPAPREIAGDHRWSRLVASNAHACGITTDGELYCWGSTLEGASINVVSGTDQVPCGLHADTPCNVDRPALVPFHPKADEVGVGSSHTCARNGTAITCWGRNNHGQLGASGALSPVTVPGTWTRLFSVGSFGTCAQQAGQTWCWGAVTGRGQPPTHDPRLDNMRWLFVNGILGDAGARGNARTLGCLLDAQSQLVCMGANDHGQFGTGAPARECGNAVCEVGESAASCAVDCPGFQVCSTDSCGNTSCSNAYASCGDGVCTPAYGETCSSCPVDCGVCAMAALDRSYADAAIGLASAESYACGIRFDGRLECWGRNSAGQVGVFDAETGRPQPFVYTPQIVAGLEGCTSVAAGNLTTCAVCSGELYCWGSNRRGQVGAGAMAAAPVVTPRKLAALLDANDRWAQVTAGTTYACARTEHGRGFCWGFHRYGALGTGASSANLPTAIRFVPR